MASLQIEQFSFTYDTRQPNILNNITLNVEPGHFYLLMGPSGSGKSTLLKAMAGLTPKFGGYITNGHILLEGQEIGPIVPFERAKYVAMLFQNPSRQFAMQTPREQLTFTLENLQLPIEKIKERVDWTLTHFNLTAFADRTLLTLSGGEQQRVALANIVSMNSDIILLDEPFANIDPISRQLLLETLKDIQKQFNKTIFITDHDPTGYNGLADHLLQFDADTGTIHNGDLNQLQTEATSKYFIGDLHGDSQLGWKKLSLTVGKSHKLLDQNTLALPQGKLGLLSGANGAGKSTLFNALAHQIPYQGTIILNQQATEKVKLKAWAKQLGLVFQLATDQFVTMTVQDELMLSKKHSLQTDYWTDDRINQAIVALNLSHVINHVVYQLSGGQQKKVQTLAMLIMAQPIILFDEPLAGLDKQSSLAVLTLIKTNIKNLKQTGLMISHQRSNLAKFIDYELVLSHQSIQPAGEVSSCTKD